ncbi:hypothetical protein JCM10212_005284 [Sporobolomyces blumeae]
MTSSTRPTRSTKPSLPPNQVGSTDPSGSSSFASSAPDHHPLPVPCDVHLGDSSPRPLRSSGRRPSSSTSTTSRLNPSKTARKARTQLRDPVTGVFVAANGRSSIPSRSERSARANSRTPRTRDVPPSRDPEPTRSLSRPAAIPFFPIEPDANGPEYGACDVRYAKRKRPEEDAKHVDDADWARWIARGGSGGSGRFAAQAGSYEEVEMMSGRGALRKWGWWDGIRTGENELAGDRAGRVSDPGREGGILGGITLDASTGQATTNARARLRGAPPRAVEARRGSTEGRGSAVADLVPLAEKAAHRLVDAESEAPLDPEGTNLPRGPSEAKSKMRTRRPRRNQPSIDQDHGSRSSNRLALQLVRATSRATNKTLRPELTEERGKEDASLCPTEGKHGSAFSTSVLASSSTSRPSPPRLGPRAIGTPSSDVVGSAETREVESVAARRETGGGETGLGRSVDGDAIRALLELGDRYAERSVQDPARPGQASEAEEQTSDGGVGRPAKEGRLARMVVEDNVGDESQKERRGTVRGQELEEGEIVECRRDVEFGRSPKLGRRYAWDESNELDQARTPYPSPTAFNWPLRGSESFSRPSYRRWYGERDETRSQKWNDPAAYTPLSPVSPVVARGRDSSTSRSSRSLELVSTLTGADESRSMERGPGCGGVCLSSSMEHAFQPRVPSGIHETSSSSPALPYWVPYSNAPVHALNNPAAAVRSSLLATVQTPFLGGGRTASE